MSQINQNGLIRLFRNKFTAKPADETDTFKAENRPEACWVCDENVVMLIPDDATKVGSIDVDAVDTNPERVVSGDTENGRVYCLVAGGTVHTLGAEYVEDVCDLLGIELDEMVTHARLRTDRGDVHPVFVGAPNDPYTIVISPRITKDGFGSSLETPPDGVELDLNAETGESDKDPLEWKPYLGDGKCDHGRTVAEDSDECPYDATQVMRDNSDEFKLCGQHHQNFIGNMAARRMI